MTRPGMAPFPILTALILVPAPATNPAPPLQAPPPLVAPAPLTAPPPSPALQAVPEAPKPRCRGLTSCLSEATSARNACITACQPQRDARMQACGDAEDLDAGKDPEGCRQAEDDYQACTDPCEERFREALTALHTETAANAARANGATAAPGMWLRLAREQPVQVAAKGDAPAAAARHTTPPRAKPGTPISPFDRLIVHHAKAEGFDWLLIAALIFEESRFNPGSRSPKGAVGLMQVRPIAAQTVGATHFQAPDANVQTGVRYLRWLDGLFPDASGRDRMNLVLAAYNMGPGHVRDAQALARRFGYDPNRWNDHMDQMLPLLESPRFYTQLANGYARGRDTVTYVQRTIERYRRYQRETAASRSADPQTVRH